MLFNTCPLILYWFLVVILLKQQQHQQTVARLRAAYSLFQQTYISIARAHCAFLCFRHKLIKSHSQEIDYNQQ